MPHTFLSRQVWIERVIARTDLSHPVKLIAVRLALHLNLKTGRCDPSYAALASGTGTNRRTAIRAAAALERAGLIAVEATVGRGNVNTFCLIEPAEKVTMRHLFRRWKR
jgi:DNA-binding IscR family transcriptional regulator